MLPGARQAICWPSTAVTRSCTASCVKLGRPAHKLLLEQHQLLSASRLRHRSSCRYQSQVKAAAAQARSYLLREQCAGAACLALLPHCSVCAIDERGLRVPPMPWLRLSAVLGSGQQLLGPGAAVCKDSSCCWAAAVASLLSCASRAPAALQELLLGRRGLLNPCSML